MPPGDRKRRMTRVSFMYQVWYLIPTACRMLGFNEPIQRLPQQPDVLTTAWSYQQTSTSHPPQWERGNISCDGKQGVGSGSASALDLDPKVLFYFFFTLKHQFLKNKPWILICIHFKHWIGSARNGFGSETLMVGTGTHLVQQVEARDVARVGVVVLRTACKWSSK